MSRSMFMPVRSASELDPESDPSAPETQRVGSTAVAREVAVLRARVQELITDRRLLEEQVRHLHRAKTISDLLAGVAHDLSGALTGILWCSEALRRRISSLDPELSAGLVDFVAAADYARKLARRLISIGRQRDSSFAVVRLQDAVSEALSLLDALRPGNVQLSCELSLPDASVWGNADELQQILVNLVTNAFDSLVESGGQVAVTLGPARDAGEVGEGWVCLRVRDTGHGMSPATLRRAFDPFFTTKSGPEGNGLGLVVVQTIVQRHAGRLTASSELGVGTTMDVLLPLSQRSREP